jgi:uncharacterized cupin superfamily protein
MKRANLYDIELEFDDDEPEGYRGGFRRIGPLLDADEVNLNVVLLEPDQAVCPYHYEYDEEWLIVLEGDVVVRTPDGAEPVGRGDVVRFPAGPEGAHKVTNAGESPARVVLFSGSRRPAVAVYPDSDKIGVFPGRNEDRLIVRREDGQRDYYDREP